MLKDCALAAILLAAATLSLSGRSFAQDVDPADLVKDIHAIFGDHHARAVHAKGIVLEARFEPTGEARALSKAIVFASKAQALVRLSDTTGIPEIPDADPNASPHGMAIKFTLTDGSEFQTHGGTNLRLAVVADPLSQQGSDMQADAPACDVCGSITVRSGTCYKCLNCGTQGGCS